MVNAEIQLLRATYEKKLVETERDFQQVNEKFVQSLRLIGLLNKKQETVLLKMQTNNSQQFLSALNELSITLQRELRVLTIIAKAIPRAIALMDDSIKNFNNAIDQLIARSRDDKKAVANLKEIRIRVQNDNLLLQELLAFSSKIMIQIERRNAAGLRSVEIEKNQTKSIKEKSMVWKEFQKLREQELKYWQQLIAKISPNAIPGFQRCYEQYLSQDAGDGGNAAFAGSITGVPLGAIGGFYVAAKFPLFQDTSQGSVFSMPTEVALGALIGGLIGVGLGIAVELLASSETILKSKARALSQIKRLSLSIREVA